MELVEERSLDHHVTPGGLPIALVTELGLAISEALVAAHEKGIVHRDLKSANVVLTRDGLVKVLDFSLAKLAIPTASDVLAPEDVTVARLSVPGRVVGTAGYMAPEQLRGESVDSRADLFALGVMLYELATGSIGWGHTLKHNQVRGVLGASAPPARVPTFPGAPKLPRRADLSACPAEAMRRRAAITASSFIPPTPDQTVRFSAVRVAFHGTAAQPMSFTATIQTGSDARPTRRIWRADQSVVVRAIRKAA
jgi:serine/threonine protein kinase